MRTIILVGPKHSGKTSVGRELASLCSCGFIDLDERIAEQCGKSPRALYAEGPGIFQAAEAAVLKDLLEPEKAHPASLLIIASGGGLIDNTDALAFLKKNAATTVFLDVCAETAWERISREGELPPFLKTDPRETHRVLHECRSAAYRQLASHAIMVGSKSPAETAREILCMVVPFLKFG
jgi:shikimate kinase